MASFGSLFSGVGGIDLGLERSGLTCLFQVEKDKSCLSVLAKHWPDKPRFTDVKEFDSSSIAVRPDWLVGGFPCQDLSVAGRRAGLAGKRSGLFHEFMRIVGEFAPTGVLIENVPGLLSSHGGRDMGIVVGALADMGYGWAYRVLDAQWFGLAQRRKRVFIVGHLGGVRRAAEILFEREGMPWDTSPCREAGKRIAGTLESRPGSGFPGTDGAANGHVVPAVSRTQSSRNCRNDGESENFVVSSPNERVAPCLRSNMHNNSDSTMESQMLVFDERNVTSAANRSTCKPSGPVPTMHSSPMTVAIRTSQTGSNGVGVQEEVAHTLDSRVEAVAVTVVFNHQSGGSKAMMGISISKTTALGTTQTPAVAFAIQERAVSDNLANGPQSKGYQEDKAFTLESRHHQQAVAMHSVRRLMPVECERLQGLPDNWTALAADGKPISDSARYRMIGNSVAVPVIEWIGKRI